MKYFSKLQDFIKHLFLDCGSPSATTFVAGMGRSGTTWVTNLINYDSSYRTMFEPFFPARISEARAFQDIQYINPQCNNRTFVKAAQKILSGQVYHYRIDRDNKKLFCNRRLIKAIRCNLMLKWLKGINPSMPIVLVIRHPFAVASSWLELGWKGVSIDTKGKQKNDFDIIISQEKLLRDFPVVKEVGQEIDTEDDFERIVFEWSVFHLIPLQQFLSGEIFLATYENFILNPAQEVEKLFDYLKQSLDWDRLLVKLKTPSRTNFLERNLTQGKLKLLHGWKDRLSSQQIQRGREILASFQLDRLYDDKGYPIAGEIF